VPGKTQELFSEIERSQVELRESIENSRRLVERSDALIRQIKDQSPELAGEAAADREPGETAVTSPR
jgi:hypothetical protein